MAFAIVSAVAYYLAFALRFELAPPSQYAPIYLATLPLLLAVRIACTLLFRISMSRWRFIGTRDMGRLAVATATGSAIFFAVTRLLPPDFNVPRSVVLIEGMLTAGMIAGSWLIYRLTYEELRLRRNGGREQSSRILIIGAGEAGSMLAREMTRFPTGLRPVGYVDDDPTKWGCSIHGIEVIGATTDLPSIAREVRADEVIIAVPSAEPVELRRIVAIAEEAGLPSRVLPGIREVLEGQVTLQQVREVRIEDLLGRQPVELELPELANDIGGKVVLVTGAAGSIGSELSRQTALHRPSKLVLLDQAETPLFYLGLELRDMHPDLEVITLVGDIVDAPAIERLFEQFEPDRVYHAAAYKHVPMMEDSPREAVRNNVLGTLHVARAAGRHGAAEFVLVSTDKAVNPANVMGASKRLAELVVLELQQLYAETTYCAVRFGNVLGSQGSVIPIFKNQLKAGKPLTVTHPEATRFFMTIPEAVQLILQASLLPQIRGQIVMLDMGEPVRIMDLAENLLRLSGANNSGEGSVVITGLRPGEKLHEELVAADEETIPTGIDKLRILRYGNGKVADLLDRVVAWSEADSEQDLVTELQLIFPGLSQDGMSNPIREVPIGGGAVSRSVSGVFGS